MTARLIDPTFRARNAAGTGVSGYKLYVYEAGTSTPINTYSESTLSSANANPIVSLANGFFPDVFVAADDYKVIYTDGSGSSVGTDVTLDTWDNINISATAPFSGGINTAGYSEHLINAQTGTTYTYLTGDRAKLVTHSNASSIAAALPQANSTTFAEGWYINVTNKGAGTLTITPTTSTINGLATLTLGTNQSAKIVSDGTNYQVTSIVINSAVNAQTGTSYTVVTGDNRKLVTFSNASAIAVTLPQANTTTFASGWYFLVSNKSTGLVTITPTTSTINGAATYTLYNGEGVTVISDGTNYQVASRGVSSMTLIATQTASASAELAFTTGINSIYKNYLFLLNDIILATDGQTLKSQIGFSGAYRSTAADYQYAGSYHRYNALAAAGLSTSATSIDLLSETASSSTYPLDGEVMLMNPSGSSAQKRLHSKVTYVVQADAAKKPQTAYQSSVFDGAATAIDRIRFYSSSGNITSGTIKMYGIL